MNDELPTIIVDNRKLTPVSRIARAAPSFRNRSDEQSAPFGVVDRVTLSKAAREKCRESQFVVDDDLPAPQLRPPERKAIPYDAAANQPEKGK
jgi:hypothetical protein